MVGENTLEILSTHQGLALGLSPPLLCEGSPDHSTPQFIDFAFYTLSIKYTMGS